MRVPRAARIYSFRLSFDKIAFRKQFFGGAHMRKRGFPARESQRAAKAVGQYDGRGEAVFYAAYIDLAREYDVGVRPVKRRVCYKYKHGCL